MGNLYGLEMQYENAMHLPKMLERPARTKGRNLHRPLQPFAMKPENRPGVDPMSLSFIQARGGFVSERPQTSILFQYRMLWLANVNPQHQSHLSSRVSPGQKEGNGNRYRLSSRKMEMNMTYHLYLTIQYVFVVYRMNTHCLTWPLQFETKIAAITVSLRDRMRFYKLRVTSNANQIASTFNEQFKPEIIQEYNDPFRVDWIQKPTEDEYFIGEKAGLNLKLLTCSARL